MITRKVFLYKFTLQCINVSVLIIVHLFSAAGGY